MDQNYFIGSLGSIALTSDAKTRSISPENFSGEKAGGGKAVQGTGAHCARELGKGWKISPSVDVAPGETLCAADIEGPGVIQSMWFGGNIGRSYIIRIYWDHQEQPSVECPLAEFFACGWTSHPRDPFRGPFYPINSIPVAVNPNRGLNCFWPMPFRSHCRITVENRSSHVYTSYYQINYALTDVPENAAYFHAQFRMSCPVEGGVHTVVDGIKGKGQYVGTALFAGLNGAGNWWGEGEMKFYLDGDTDYPTICGTGTEDYFGGSYDWEVDGKYQTYTTPFMGMYQVQQSDGLYSHQQRFSMYRWHIMDPVRFDADLRITLQDLGWKETGDLYLKRRDDLISVAYWYQTLETQPFPQLPDDGELWMI